MAEDCAWPGCPKRRSELPLCEAHLLIVHAHVEGRREKARPSAPQDTSRSVVYYLRVGDLVKIGYASNLERRLTAYPPDSVLLATEPGGRELEAQRHREMAHHLRSGREWFVPSPPLMEHISAIVAEHGPPRVIRARVSRQHNWRPKEPVTVRHAERT